MMTSDITCFWTRWMQPLLPRTSFWWHIILFSKLDSATLVRTMLLSWRWLMTIISYAPRTSYSLITLNHKLLSVTYHAWTYACQLMVQTAIEYEIIEILLRLNSTLLHKSIHLNLLKHQACISSLLYQKPRVVLWYGIGKGITFHIWCLNSIKLTPHTIIIIFSPLLWLQGINTSNKLFVLNGVQSVIKWKITKQ
jgi:hypothetical protein